MSHKIYETFLLKKRSKYVISSTSLMKDYPTSDRPITSDDFTKRSHEKIAFTKINDDDDFC